MAGHKKTEITIETSEIVVIRRARYFRAWCRECGRETKMVAMADAQAVVAASGTGRELDPALHWHVCQAQNETALICLESLLKSV